MCNSKCVRMTETDAPPSVGSSAQGAGKKGLRNRGTEESLYSPVMRLSPPHNPLGLQYLSLQGSEWVQLAIQAHTSFKFQNHGHRLFPLS